MSTLIAHGAASQAKRVQIYSGNLNVGHDVVCGNYMFYQPNYTGATDRTTGVRPAVCSAAAEPKCVRQS